MTDSSPGSKRVVIRVQDAPTPSIDPAVAPSAAKARPATGPPLGLTLGLTLASVGGTLASFGPLLPWWQEVSTRLHVSLGGIGGLSAWPGYIGLTGGIVVLSLAAYLAAKARPAGSLGLITLAAGAVATLAALFALTSGKELTHSALVIHPGPGAYLTLAGGILAAAGGFVQTREGPRS